MNKTVAVGLVVLLACSLGGWRFVSWANRSTLAIYNGTEVDVDVSVDGRVVHVAAGAYRDLGKLTGATRLVTTQNGATLDELTLDADRTTHLLYNVAGAGELYVADYSGLYECEGHGGAVPIAIAAYLKGQTLYSYEGRFLLGRGEPLPEAGIDCSVGIVRAEVIPAALLGKDEPLQYLMKQLRREERFRIRFP